MNYKQTLDFLFNQLPMYQRKGLVALKKDLSNIRSLSSVLGSPHKKFRSIHIAGTNGKGSVSHFIASILQEQGLKVGLYTSPHYKDFRERIKINGEFISKQEVVKFVKKIKTFSDDISPSFFEITVAMAFDYFANQKVDVAVIETGLGGRLDSTNIINPILSVITNIGLDHTHILGNTFQEIAGEKAGIIKSGIPIIIGKKNKETAPVFNLKAKIQDANLTFTEDEIKVFKESDYIIQFEIQDVGKLTLKNERQDPFFVDNVRTSLAAIRELDLSGNYIITPETMVRGIKNVQQNTYYIGRWHRISNSPTVIADSAHNQDGLIPVLEQLQKQEYDNLHIVLGFVNDKNLKEIVPLFPKQARYYFAKANIPRGLNAEKLANVFNQEGYEGRSYISVKNALIAAKRAAGKEDFIFIGGSIFVVAEVL